MCVYLIFLFKRLFSPSFPLKWIIQPNNENRIACSVRRHTYCKHAREHFTHFFASRLKRSTYTVMHCCTCSFYIATLCAFLISSFQTGPWLMLGKWQGIFWAWRRQFLWSKEEYILKWKLHRQLTDLLHNSTVVKRVCVCARVLCGCMCCSRP